jgi:hypothetical protein
MARLLGAPEALVAAIPAPPPRGSCASPWHLRQLQSSMRARQSRNSPSLVKRMNASSCGRSCPHGLTPKVPSQAPANLRAPPSARPQGRCTHKELSRRIATVAGPEHDSSRWERGTAKRVGPAAVTFRQSSDGRLGKLSLHPCRFGCQRSSTLPMLAPIRSVSQDCR